MLQDEDDQKTPEQYCQEIQKQFQKIAEDKVKQFEYFIFGALSAYKNQHYHHAYSFISQAPFICNIAEERDDIESMVYYELMKMIEVKVLGSKMERVEQGIITLINHYYDLPEGSDNQMLQPVGAAQEENKAFCGVFWPLYKTFKYQMKLIISRQFHY